MKDKIVTSQAELDAIPVDYNGRIIIKFGTPNNRAAVTGKYLYSVEARGSSSVEARGSSSVVARDNSSVEAFDSSSVVARDNSSVEARGSSVVARDNSSVVAWGNSSVEARGSSSVVARGNSSVVAWGNSSVVAWGNSQIVDAARRGNIKITGNARIVYNPSTIEAWADSNDIRIEHGKIKLYKAVHKRDGRYISDWDGNFTYTIGEVAQSNGFTYTPEEACGRGIHMATASLACIYGSNWKDLALLELEADAEEVVVPLYETGKVRAPKAKVIREVPLEEAGLMGKILAKRRG